MSYETERHEEDRLDLLHEIVFRAKVKEWELVDKYKQLYREIYGPLPFEGLHDSTD